MFILESMLLFLIHLFAFLTLLDVVSFVLIPSKKDFRVDSFLNMIGWWCIGLIGTSLMVVAQTTGIL
jgi:hypothetical protein